MNPNEFFQVTDIKTSLFWIFIFLVVVIIGIILHHRKKSARPHLR